MSTFHLEVVTLDGRSFAGDVRQLMVRTVHGDVCIQPGHIDYVTALGMGEAKIWTEAGIRRAACIGGLLSVKEDQVRLAPTTFEWAEEIDLARAERAKSRAEEVLHDKANKSDQELRLAEARLKRALVRTGVSRG
ncbi:MAG: ATP synthase F1 subunit epsilon [bacterium]